VFGRVISVLLRNTQWDDVTQDYFFMLFHAAITPFMTIYTSKSVHFEYIHSIMSYGIIFWGNPTDSKNVLTTYKTIIKSTAEINKNLLSGFKKN
jgi:hypothetical protein